MLIVTHTNPDLDAICGVWLLKRFVDRFKDAQIEYVNTGNPDRTLLAQADAVVDTGQKFDNAKFFDHHQFPGGEAISTCAAKQVYDFIRYHVLGGLAGPTEVDHLETLVNLVFAGDTARPEANASRELGLHAIYSGWRAWFMEQNPGERLPDQAALVYGFGLLDVLEVRLRHMAEARLELAQKVVYKSKDGLLWAIRHGSSGSTFAAYEAGARIVLFEGEPLEVEGGTTYPVGIMRTGEWTEPHVGELVGRAIDYIEQWESQSPEAMEIELPELTSWYRHPGGFFAGRGTAKAPVFEPVKFDLSTLARLVDRVWAR